ncbi:hypothetical protein BJX63DRAFT_432297 [Aspergillus granulosus]|uniref:Uncharacterized protein n=1 Tax=Aspergillus granulosus TaxID=176169 RepID=A0ABR4HC08_9EURO
MSTPISLPTTSYEGNIDGVSIMWSSNAIDRIPINAVSVDVDQLALKSVTERVALASAKRLNKTKVKILGTFHKTTTIRSTGKTENHPCHCTVSLNPGDATVHIYAKVDKETDLDALEVEGESVVPKGKTAPDPALSTGSYPAAAITTI